MKQPGTAWLLLCRAPFTGCAWIETLPQLSVLVTPPVARPLQGARGLKLGIDPRTELDLLVARPLQGARGLKHRTRSLIELRQVVARPLQGARGLKQGHRCDGVRCVASRALYRVRVD